MLSIVPTTNYNMNFKATSNMPDLPAIEKTISVITVGEVIPKEAVQRSIPKMLLFLSSIPLIGYFANLYIIRLERAAKEEKLKQEQIERAAKEEQLNQEQIEKAAKETERLKEYALKKDSDGKTMALKLLENGKLDAFRMHVDKYPDVLLIRANDGKSCLIEAAYLYNAHYTSDYRKLVNYIANKLVSNPDYNPNEQAKSTIYMESTLVAESGDTDAHILVREGMSDAFNTIASHPKTDLLIRNADGETCMDVALKNNECFIINFLAKKM